jgi:O-succinylbenzoic acid--CoA ligase
VRYIAGKMMLVRALVGGLDLFITEPSSVPEIIPEKVVFSAMVPLQLSRLLRQSKGKESLERIDRLIIGGAFVSESLEQSIQEISTEIWQTYGMTETITHIALRKLNGAGRSGWYEPLTGVSVRLNKDNCLVVDALHVGVKNLVTTDLAETDTAGRFKIKGRTDNVIISGGVKFHPEEIEKKISGIFSNAFFIGSKPDDELGQKLVLYIEGEAGDKPKKTAILNALKQKLSPLEIPKEIVFLPVIRRTATGKIDRKSPAGDL